MTESLRKPKDQQKEEKYMSKGGTILFMLAFFGVGFGVGLLIGFILG